MLLNYTFLVFYYEFVFSLWLYSKTTAMNLKLVWIDFLQASRSVFKYKMKVFSSILRNIPYKLKTSLKNLFQTRP